MPATMQAEFDAPFQRRREPSAGAHTLHLRIWVDQELPGARSLIGRIRAAARIFSGRRPSGVSMPSVAVLRDSQVLGGKAVIGGTRIPVFMIRDLYGDERDVGRVAESYPELTDEEIMGALIYAARVDPEGVAADREQYYSAIPEHLRA